MDKLALNNINDNPSRKDRKRVGRGTGSGVGKQQDEAIKVRNLVPEAT